MAKPRCQDTTLKPSRSSRNPPTSESISRARHHRSRKREPTIGLRSVSKQIQARFFHGIVIGRVASDPDYCHHGRTYDRCERRRYSESRTRKAGVIYTSISAHTAPGQESPCNGRQDAGRNDPTHAFLPVRRASFPRSRKREDMKCLTAA